ncbi:hypothetical protein GHT06_022532 [Daphnia sinensis]|uniref:HTH CENPB-type domain-containing protein n=1 Tax=Daphnia sinensis TaxID=1820382 RepID=A0AAD5PR75_9CRUS|nr:hypothetical protein GHT06_022532 [Daphnia sinensis]
MSIFGRQNESYRNYSGKKSEKYIASLFGVSKSKIHRSVNKKNINKFSNWKVFKPSKQQMANESRYPELDAAILNWLNAMRNTASRCKPLSLPLSRAHIQAHASHEAKNREILNFKADESDEWFRNWRERCSCVCYRASNVFNMDEAGFFYRALSTRTYASSAEKKGSRKSIRRTKALRAKDRFTLVLCVNATGSCKSSKNPHSFRDQPSPIPYVWIKSA